MTQTSKTAWLSEPLIIAGDMAGAIGLGDARRLWERALLADVAAFELSLSNLVAAQVDAWIVPTDRLNPITLASLEESDADCGAALIEDMVNRVRKASSHIRCIGAVGPVEPILALGEIDESELLDAYTEQITALADAGVDAIVCRSFAESAALKLAVRVSKEKFKGPIIASMSFDAGLDGLETVLGVGVAEMCGDIIELGADAIGVDRTEFPDGMPAVVGVMRAATELPIYAESNAGGAELIDDARAYPEKPAAFADRYAKLVESGANLIAGGLGTTAPHMAALARARQAFARRRAKKQG